MQNIVNAIPNTNVAPKNGRYSEEFSIRPVILKAIVITNEDTTVNTDYVIKKLNP